METGTKLPTDPWQHPLYGADIDPTAQIGEGTKVWPFATVREGALIGRDCVIGRGAYIDHHVIIGDRVHIQNGAQVYWPCQIDDEVFVGPNVVLTNDKYPRVGNNWQANVRTTRVHAGASIGAGAIIMPGLYIGAGAMVGAGSVVTHPVQVGRTVVGAPARSGAIPYIPPGSDSGHS